MSVVKGYVLPGLPQPLLCPEKNPGYQRLRAAFDAVRQEIVELEADVILVYSTMWPSVIGHQIQARPEPEWVHVDELFHDLGSMHYKFRIDSDLAHAYCDAAKKRGLSVRTVDYHGFPIDTGSVVALKLINPDNRLPAVITSSNVYADRAETIVFGKSARDALDLQGKKAVAIIVSTLSNRVHQTFIDPKDDSIHSLKDNEWNLKILEFLKLGRLEDVSQLSRQIHREARVHKVNNFKSIWWLSTLMGAHNRYQGEVLAYEAVYGTGCAVVSMTPALQASRDLEFDESSPDHFSGDRNVLAPSAELMAGMSSQTSDPGHQGEL
jgi:2-aminophenol/2-amino-5-chlorophenol 1,6-dioxygenase subunit alpha